MEERKFKAIEVAVMVGISEQTLNMWYQFKRENPHNKYAKMIPKYEQSGERQNRYWTQEDIWKLIEFKQKLPRGRNGIMGKITQKYVKEEKSNGKKNMGNRKSNKRGKVSKSKTTHTTVRSK